MNVDKITILRR